MISCKEYAQVMKETLRERIEAMDKSQLFQLFKLVMTRLQMLI